jgi:hypothetical protein
MSEPRARELIEELDPVEHDPDKGSSWNTVNDTEEIEDILSEQELEDFMSEPTEGELGVLSDSDVPGRPG